jgi:hypothetical protein
MSDKWTPKPYTPDGEKFVPLYSVGSENDEFNKWVHETRSSLATLADELAEIAKIGGAA